MTDQPPNPQQPLPGQQPYPPVPGGYPQQPYYQQQPPPKKRRVWLWVLLGFVLAFIVLIGGCMAFLGGVANEIDKESKREVVVTYEVEGDAGSPTITYSGRDFNTAQETDAQVPWSKDVTIDGLGKTVSLTATNDQDGGNITCRIKADGNVVSEQTSTGPFATVNCFGDAGE